MDSMNIPDNMSEDEMFEGLPLKLRRQVMKHWAGDTTDETGTTEELEPVSTYSIKVMVKPLLIGIPIFFVGFVLTATILLAPIGVPIMLLGCVPATRALRKQIDTKD